MKGKITEYNSEMKSGMIRGENDNEYEFSINDYKVSIRPLEGFEVDFEPSGDTAKDICAAVNIHTEETNQGAKKSNNAISILLVFILIFSIAALIVMELMSNTTQRKVEELQKIYIAQLKNIENQINQGNCTEAVLEYSRARETRNEIDKTGLYFSIETFKKQAHTIEIAECFAQHNEFVNAIGMLDLENNNDANYFRRASDIYEKSGDHAKAQEAQAKAERMDH